MTKPEPVTDPAAASAYLDSAVALYGLEDHRELLDKATITRADDGVTITVQLFVAYEDLVR